MNITPEQRSTIETTILNKYEKVAGGVPGQFRYPTGEEGLHGLGYHPGWYAHLPTAVRRCFCGVGNPFSLGRPAPGAHVLDIGCGCGVDVLVAAGFVGGTGKAVGVERSPHMLAKARENAEVSGCANAVFQEGAAEALPVEDASADLVTSSGVFNLVIDKPKALAEAFRVLRPGGRLQIADQMLTAPQPASVDEMVASWFT